jgi:hypothetical protein
MEPKGYIFVKREFVATKLWPSPQFTLQGTIDLEFEYKKALGGRPVQVMDIAVDGSGYLVLGHSDAVGTFLWSIEKEDTIGDILPVKWKNGELIPTGMDPIGELMYLVKNMRK